MSNLQFITIISSVILVISILGNHGRCEARSISSASEAARFLPPSYVKRNYGKDGDPLDRRGSWERVMFRRRKTPSFLTWWSKKSLDNLPENLKENLKSSDHANCDSIVDIMKCYSSSCVTDFVLCTKNAEREDVYDMCKVEHEICAAKCFGTDIEDRK